MTYLRTNSHKVPKLYPGQRRFERRIDEHTAADIGDALRADSVQAAAQAMDHLQVDVQVAMRVLAGTTERGKKRRHAGRDTSTAT
jgi:hypothetical protein